MLWWQGDLWYAFWSGIESVVSVPSGIGPVVWKLGATMLIQCKHRSLALITHFGAWKLLEIGM